MKLYDIFNVVDNKTVRKHENFYKRFKKASKDALGTMVKTNRGYFIDGHHVDLRSAKTWFEINGYNKEAASIIIPEPVKVQE